MIFNQLVTDSLYLECMGKISILKKERIIKKNSYEWGAYESVIFQKATENKTWALMG